MNKTCIIIPCYNEESRIDLDSYIFFSQQNPQTDLLFVNDGSTDNTRSTLFDLAQKSNNINVINLDKNQGKSYAIRDAVLTALKQSDYHLIGFIDADLPIHLIENLLGLTDENQVCDLFYNMKDVNLFYSKNFVRRSVSKTLATLNKVIFSLDIIDTQCGCKLFKAPLARKVFEKKFISRWLFDLEIFLRIRLLNKKQSNNFHHKGILNQELKPSPNKSRVNNIIQMPFDYLKIYVQYKILKRNS